MYHTLYCFKFLNVFTVNKCLLKKFITQKKKEKRKKLLVKGMRLLSKTLFLFPFSSHCFLIAVPFFSFLFHTKSLCQKNDAYKRQRSGRIFPSEAEVLFQINPY